MMKTKNAKFIVVDKDKELFVRVKNLFEPENLAVTLERSIDRVLGYFENDSYDVLIITSSAFHSNETENVEILEVISRKSPETQIIFLSETKHIKMAFSALNAGSYQYSRLPISDTELKLLINEAVSKQPVSTSRIVNRKSKVKFDELIGSSPAMQKVYVQIRQAASTDIPVLLLGETGTGKDLAAKAVHNKSLRKESPFIPVNLAALPDDLVASELFGHEKGAFTGASQKREGMFELANDGVIFLDEINSINERIQISLLRLLEEKRFNRIGGKKSIKTNARIIAASNQDLYESVKDGDFREDLYYRLDVFQITMPPLRDHLSDIPILVEAFIKKYNPIYDKKILGIAPELISILENYNWPGNVRELKNVIQRAVLVCKDSVLTAKDLPARFKITRRAEKLPFVSIPVGTPLREVERIIISKTLSALRNNKNKTAQVLGISRRALYNKLQRMHTR